MRSEQIRDIRERVRREPVAVRCDPVERWDGRGSSGDRSRVAPGGAKARVVNPVIRWSRALAAGLVLALAAGTAPAQIQLYKQTEGSRLTPLNFEAVAYYGAPGQRAADGRPWRPQVSYMLGKPWKYRPPGAERVRGQLEFTIDLTGWVAAPRLVAGNPDSVDYMVKFLTFKSNNRNTVAFYVDGDRFRIETRPTDGSGSRYLFHEVERIDTVHRFSVSYHLWKPSLASREKRRPLVVRYGDREIGRLPGPLLFETAEGGADYWILGLDLRRVPPPEGVASRRAVFGIQKWQ